MPQIKGYEAPDLNLQPSERASDAAAAAARTIGHFNTVGAANIREAGQAISSGIEAAGSAAVRYIEHREISHGAATYAALNDRLTNEWNEIAKKADPNDPTVAARFREEVLEPALQDYSKGFLTEGGLRFAENRVESIRNHMFTKTAADMSSLAAQAVSVNVGATANRLSNTAMNDPSSVPNLLKNADELVGGIVDSSPNIKGADSGKARMGLTEKMKEAIVKAGAQGAIAKAANPEAEAARWGQMYPQYISGADLKTLSGNARSEIRARNYDHDLARRRANEIAKDKSVEAFNEYYADVRAKDPRVANDPTAQKILHDDRLTKSDRNQLINLIDRELKPETNAAISAQTSTKLFRMMADPNMDYGVVRSAIIEARSKDPGAAGSLSKADYDDAMKNLADLKTPEGQALTQDRNEFVKRYAGTIDGYLAEMGVHSALGQQKIYAFERDARRLERELKKKGQDPHSLYDHTSPNFFGKPGNLQKYQVSMQDAMAYSASINKNLTAPGTTITGVEVTDMPFRAPPNWQFSASRKQYRDPSGNIYDINGKPVK